MLSVSSSSSSLSSSVDSESVGIALPFVTIVGTALGVVASSSSSSSFSSVGIRIVGGGGGGGGIAARSLSFVLVAEVTAWPLLAVAVVVFVLSSVESFEDVVAVDGASSAASACRHCKNGCASARHVDGYMIKRASEATIRVMPMTPMLEEERCRKKRRDAVVRESPSDLRQKDDVALDQRRQWKIRDWTERFVAASLSGFGGR